MTADRLARLDQAEAAAADVARVVARFVEGLTEAGLTRNEALRLGEICLANLLRG